ncbi:hypothetical protein CH063_02810 [Colletotrichum higginsianum]|uniref:Uncharacterized protein n=1 Tax=Colletotrichum higginsianum (strain IMI 349063) TaxID=759273 RepID=H1VQ70_COLHI|nr:hypothetical protein CH063_02810 [Colletotrichum higginsianum]
MFAYMSEQAYAMQPLGHHLVHGLNRRDETRGGASAPLAPPAPAPPLLLLLLHVIVVVVIIVVSFLFLVQLLLSPPYDQTQPDARHGFVRMPCVISVRNQPLLLAPPPVRQSPRLPSRPGDQGVKPSYGPCHPVLPAANANESGAGSGGVWVSRGAALRHGASRIRVDGPPY